MQWGWLSFARAVLAWWPPAVCMPGCRGPVPDGARCQARQVPDCSAAGLEGARVGVGGGGRLQYGFPQTDTNSFVLFHLRGTRTVHYIFHVLISLSALSLSLSLFLLSTLAPTLPLFLSGLIYKWSLPPVGTFVAGCQLPSPLSSPAL